MRLFKRKKQDNPNGVAPPTPEQELEMVTRRRIESEKRLDLMLSHSAKWTRRAVTAFPFGIAIILGFFLMSLGIDIEQGDKGHIFVDLVFVVMFGLMLAARLLDLHNDAAEALEQREVLREAQKTVTGLATEARQLVKEAEDARERAVELVKELREKKKQATIKELTELADDEAKKDAANELNFPADMPEPVKNILDKLFQGMKDGTEINQEELHDEMLEEAMSKVISEYMDEVIEEEFGGSSAKAKESGWRPTNPKYGLEIAARFKELSGHDATVTWVGEDGGWNCDIDKSHENHSHDRDDAPVARADREAAAKKTAPKKPAVKKTAEKPLTKSQERRIAASKKDNKKKGDK